ncbi:hypothetical protein LAX5112_00789 [Roseibium alexandrii]|uniref:Uncharacterized protein n=1 Tax=Roseibium alexandrii TaxID=388408 RepID=A0A0M6ZUZ4_9HYPH|nr:hypothetical protein LAX5112_00789 [Roseibium alexandrii]
MPNLLGRHYRMLSAALSVNEKPRSCMRSSVFRDPGSLRSSTTLCAAKPRSASVSNSTHNHQQSVAGAAFTRHVRLCRFADRGSHSS